MMAPGTAFSMNDTGGQGMTRPELWRDADDICRE